MIRRKGFYDIVVVVAHLRHKAVQIAGKCQNVEIAIWTCFNISDAAKKSCSKGDRIYLLAAVSHQVFQASNAAKIKPCPVAVYCKEVQVAIVDIANKYVAGKPFTKPCRVKEFDIGDACGLPPAEHRICIV